MNVFISYSVQDGQIVQTLADALGKITKKVFFWDEFKNLGERPWETINKRIEESDAVVALITGSSIERPAVAKEIGIAEKAGKKILALVTDDVPRDKLGFLDGITYQALDPAKPATAIEVLKKKISELAADKETRQTFGLILAGALLFALASSE